MSEINNQPVLLLDFDTYVAITYKLSNLPRGISFQNGLKEQFLALPFSKAIAEELETYYNPEKNFLVDPVKYAQHEKLIFDSWLAENWVYEEMLDKSARRSQ